MAADDSFVTPGSIPFRWEIRPGVPKIYHRELSPPFHQQEVDRYHNTTRPSSVPGTPQKLKPPPAGYYSNLHRAPEIRPYETQSVSQGCFPTSPLLRQKSKRKGIKKLLKPEFGSEWGYSLDLETLARWSESSWKSFAFYDSPSSSSFSSFRSSPRPACDAEWAGFGLF
ncbi:Pistil-specific extensin protein [Heracleum sosnowskyi]|uniref:Pistil-specific extensin protein n=1 Tax=Heracleum sosnowskyi TaxID=360622 RepID=A0AAD8HR85_9APIA|nr:Pistil-specific extensin protein [Heracleum sosnowskyi]